MPHTILIVEDDQAIRETLAEVLRVEGYSVITAEDAVKALDLLSTISEPPCLILLDLMMPHMNGWEFIQKQRKCQTIATIPVVILTAASTLIRSNVDDHDIPYLKKPIDMDGLLATIQKYGNSCGHARPNIDSLTG